MKMKVRNPLLLAALSAGLLTSLVGCSASSFDTMPAPTCNAKPWVEASGLALSKLAPTQTGGSGKTAESGSRCEEYLDIPVVDFKSTANLTAATGLVATKAVQNGWTVGTPGGCLTKTISGTPTLLEIRQNDGQLYSVNALPVLEDSELVHNCIKAPK